MHGCGRLGRWERGNKRWAEDGRDTKVVQARVHNV